MWVGMSKSEGVNASQVEAEALQALMEQIHKQVADYSQNLLSELNQTCHSMEARQKGLNAQIDQLSQTLSSSRSELEQTRVENQQQRQDNQKLMAQETALKQAAQQEHDELLQLRESHAGQTEQLNTQQQRISELEQQLLERAQQRDAACSDLEQEQSRSEALQQQLTEVEARAESFAIKVARYAESEKLHTEQLEQASGENRTAKRQLEYAETRVVELEAEIKQQQTENAKLKAAYQQLTRDMEQTYNRAEEINSAFRRCKIELDKRDDELHALQQRLEQVLNPENVDKE